MLTLVYGRICMYIYMFNHKYINNNSETNPWQLFILGSCLTFSSNWYSLVLSALYLSSEVLRCPGVVRNVESTSRGKSVVSVSPHSGGGGGGHLLSGQETPARWKIPNSQYESWPLELHGLLEVSELSLQHVLCECLPVPPVWWATVSYRSHQWTILQIYRFKLLQGKTSI